MKQPIKVLPTWGHLPWRGSIVYVRVRGRKNPLTINVYPHTVWDGRRKADVIKFYQVNWAALGSVPAETTKWYAQAMLVAATEAERLTAIYGGKKKPDLIIP